MKAFEKTLAWLRGKNVVVYDLEIATEIDSVINGQKAGWNRLDLHEISVGCLFDYRSGDVGVYLAADIPRLVERLNEADLVVGFNIKGFDNALLRAKGHALKPDAELPQYDMLEATRRGLGWTEGTRFPRGCKLDHHLEAMFGKALMKTGDGALAPTMWRQGKIAEVISYCLADVRRERMVFEHVWLHGWTQTPENGKALVHHPSRFIRGLNDKRDSTAGSDARVPGGGEGNDLGAHHSAGPGGGGAEAQVAAPAEAAAPGGGHLPHSGSPVPGLQGEGQLGHSDSPSGGEVAP